MQNPEAYSPSIRASCWTLPGSQIGKDGKNEEKKKVNVNVYVVLTLKTT